MTRICRPNEKLGCCRLAAPKLPNGFHPSDLILGMGGWIDSRAATPDSPAVELQTLTDLIDYLWDLLVGLQGPATARSALLTWMMQNQLTLRDWQREELEKAIQKRGAM